LLVALVSHPPFLLNQGPEGASAADCLKYRLIAAPPCLCLDRANVYPIYFLLIASYAGPEEAEHGTDESGIGA
jgi:hypothetical protein